MTGISDIDTNDCLISEVAALVVRADKATYFVFCSNYEQNGRIRVLFLSAVFPIYLGIEL